MSKTKTIKRETAIRRLRAYVKTQDGMSMRINKGMIEKMTTGECVIYGADNIVLEAGSVMHCMDKLGILFGNVVE